MLTESIEHNGVTYIVRIGQSAQENWDLIDDSSQNDIWFHLSKFPSPHVVLQNPENISIKKIPKQLIVKCADLCKYHNKYSSMTVTIIYTEIKNVTKADKVGAVHTKKTVEIVM